MSNSLGQNIKKAREEAGLTQEELGSMIGVTGVTIMRYEKGQREPKIEIVEKLARAMGISKQEILGWSREPTPLDEAVLEIYPGYDPTKETIPEYLARKEAEKNSEPPEPPAVTEEDIKFALFGGAGEITDEMYDEVKAFVQFVKMKHGQK